MRAYIHLVHLLPLLVGGPDMAKKKDTLGIKFNSKIIYKNKTHKFNNLKTYLAGLYEGDGHTWIQKQNVKKKHKPRFCITFGLKNEALAKKILDLAGSGFIRYKPKNNACVFISGWFEKYSFSY